MPKRLCGDARYSGVYGECGTSPWGKPVEHFLFCPPQPVPAWVKVLDRGAVIEEYQGKYHIFDRFGLPYLNVADPIEEIRQLGVSRRYSPTLPWEKLGPGSGMFFIHPRAWIENWKSYGERSWECPRTKNPHDPEFQHASPYDDLIEWAMSGHVSGGRRDEFCSSLWWEDIEGGKPIEGSWSARAVERAIPSGPFAGYSRPEDVEPQYVEMMFAWFPLTRLVTVRGTEEDNKKHMEAIGKSGLPTALVDE